MTEVLEVNSEVAQKIISEAAEKGLPIEDFLKSIIKNERLAEMRDAVNDKLFLEDLIGTMEDFRQIDFEK